MKLKFFVTVVVVIVAAVVVAGFIYGGSPQAARRERLDEIRLGHLQQLEGLVIRYWELNQALPDSLDEAAANELGSQLPADPATGIQYQYEKTAADTFRLCAVFSTAQERPEDYFGRYNYRPAAPAEGMTYQLMGGNWSHPVGASCFERKIAVIKNPITPPAALK